MVSQRGFDAPFAESSEMRRIRQTARKLAAGRLPVVFSGEPGTGRRVLAEAVAASRNKDQSAAVVVLGGAGVEPPVRESVRHGLGPRQLIVREIHLLGEADQRWIADAIAKEAVAVAATSELVGGRIAPLVPALDAHLAGTTFLLPPLRDRAADLSNWTDLLLAGTSAAAGRTGLMFGAEARQAIMLHRWPGNLVELDSRIQRAVAICEGEAIRPADLGLAAEPPESSSIRPFREAVEAFRLEYVARVVERLGGNRTQAAKVLGLDPRSVFRALEDLRRQRGE